MNISKIMSTNLITLKMDDDLIQAKALFDQHKIHHLFITNEGKLCGIITDSDLYKKLSPTLGTAKETHKDAAQANIKVHLVMTRELITAPPTLSISQAVLLFDHHKVTCLPIVNEQGHPLGIVTWRDVLSVIAQQYRQNIKNNVNKNLKSR
jgi:acetoin utilization protein AcuB